MSHDTPTHSPPPDTPGRLLDRLQALGEVPVVNPRRGRLPGVELTGDRTWVAVAWGVATFAVLAAAAVVTVVFGDRIGGFIYANF